MDQSAEYIIVAEKHYGESATHVELAEQVNKMIKEGFQPLGAPFIGEEMMYQALIKKRMV